MPEVSVIVISTGRWEFLKGSVGSALLQQDVDFDLVLVLNGTNVEQHRPDAWANDPRVRTLVTNRRLGTAGARNAGLQHVTSPIVAFLDDDDIWAPYKLRRQLEAIRDTGHAWAACGAVHVDTEMKTRWFDQPPPQGDCSTRVLERNIIPGGGSGTVAKRDAVVRAGCFDESIQTSEDWDLWIRLSLMSPVATVDAPLVAYRLHGGGMSLTVQFPGTDLDRIEEKYREERRARGVSMDLAVFAAWQADRCLRVGNAHEAARIYWRAFKLEHRFANILRAAKTIIAPRQSVRSRRDRIPQLPAGWQEEFDGWFAPYRRECGT